MRIIEKIIFINNKVIKKIIYKREFKIWNVDEKILFPHKLNSLHRSDIGNLTTS